MRCCECGGEVILFHTREYICTRCGLVNGVDTVASFSDTARTAYTLAKAPVRLGTCPRGRFGGLFSSSEKRLSKVIDYIRDYTNGHKQVEERAIFLARKHLKRVGRRESLEAFAVACVEVAMREVCRTSILSTVDRNCRKKAKKYLREVLGNPPLDFRELTLKKVVEVCAKLGLDYLKCLGTLSEVEQHLSGKTPSTAAAVVVYLTHHSRYDLATIAKAAGIQIRTVRRALSELPEDVIYRYGEVALH